MMNLFLKFWKHWDENDGCAQWFNGKIIGVHGLGYTQGFSVAGISIAYFEKDACHS